MIITDEHWEKIFLLRDRLALKTFKIDMYDYQKEFSNKIIKAVLLGTGETILAEFTRQSGKTEAVCITVDFLNFFYYSLKKKLDLYFPEFFNIGIFAPQAEQANTDFIKIRDYLDLMKEEGYDFVYDGNNSDHVKLKSLIDPNTKKPMHPVRNNYCFSLSPTSHAESKTMHFILFEEAQDLIDFKVKKTAQPMGAQTNAVEVWIGTAGYTRCLFKQNLDQLPDEQKVIVDYKRALREREKKYKETGNPIHLNYQKHIDKKLREMGIDDDEFKTQYALIWVLERGQFITYENLVYLENDYGITTYLDENNIRTPKEVFKDKCTAGIDWGKVNDSTILTVVDETGRIQYWLELKGDDYGSQVYILSHILKYYFPNCFRVTCDATANQDMAVDPLRNSLNSEWGEVEVIGLKFSAESKDLMYKNLHRLMMGKKMNDEYIEEPWIKYPKNWEGIEKEKFLRQFIDLQKEIRNYKWVCNHPKGNAYHDDCCDSLALAVYEKAEEVTGINNYESYIA